jgi:hypothetical protein
MQGLLGQSWLTTVIGIVLAVLNAVLPLVQNGVVTKQELLQSAGYAALGWAAKSFNVSGTDQPK